MQGQNSSPTLEPLLPFMQPQSEETLKISPNLHCISETTLPLSIGSKGSIILSEQSDDIQKYEDYIIDVGPNLEPVGPSGMLSTVEQALFEMGFNEQNLIILH
ncbi:hypothetical protein C2G38_2179729 [Gigaspora rosea]|uniref:Uncharacterized protein n=1 Tax=Gigaspora rosea TaxID=44941 RepID=A0A397VGY4_9GLOM|nr:hypothetical protein C2G38_2179729 [Gigaspora rosea]